MTKIKSVRITAYETSDGMRHETHSAAVEHDIRLQIEGWLNTSPLADDFSFMEDTRRAISKWLVDKADTIGPLLRRATQAKRIRVAKPKLPLLRPIPPGTYTAEVVCRVGGMAVFKLCERPFVGREVSLPMTGNLIAGTRSLITIKNEVSK